MVVAVIFRGDLFYRVSVFRYFAFAARAPRGYNPIWSTISSGSFAEGSTRNLGITDKALQLLEATPGSANVANSEHTIERAVALEKKRRNHPERLPNHITITNPERIKAEFSLPRRLSISPLTINQLEKLMCSKRSEPPGQQTRRGTAEDPRAFAAAFAR